MQRMLLSEEMLTDVFLISDSTAWEETEVDGMFYQYNDNVLVSYCGIGYERATAKSSVQFDIFKRKSNEIKSKVL